MTKLFLLCIALLNPLNATNIRNQHLINGILPMQQATQSYPPDISFCIVDLKYNKPHLKVCEFGEGVVSGFYGYQRLYGQGKIWDAFWRFLGQSQYPIFYIDPQCQSYASTVEKSLTTLKNIGGNLYKSVSTMVAGTRFNLALKKKQSPILVSRRQHKIFNDYRAITNTYPNAILLDNATRPFLLNKILTHLLFMNDPEMSDYRPGCKILPTRYTPTMAQEIIQDIPSSHYVIKPMNAFHGKGILFVEQNDLDHTLKTVLCPPEEPTITPSTPHQYWRVNPKPYFLVESREASQPIKVFGNNYDATMRVAFGISYDGKQNINITFFGAYWKLPKKSLDCKGSLSERYQSHIQPNTACSAKVDSKTLNEVETILRKMLPKVYIKMIAARHDPELLPAILAEINGSCPDQDDGV